MTKNELASLVAAADIANQAAKADLVKGAASGKHGILSAVKDFQSLEGSLGKPDGKWGPNTSAAARWYLQREVTAPIWNAKGKITWHPPTEESEVAFEKKQKVKPSHSVATHAVLMHAAKKDMPKYGQEPLLAQHHDVEEHLATQQIAKGIDAKVSKPVKQIKKLILQQAIQQQATAEHKKIVKDDGFKKQVIGQLATLIKRMPDGPQKVAIGRRFLGLILP
jgi:hypothetical protein